MPLNKVKPDSPMFRVGWTWNPYWGCSHECKYCWAKGFADRMGWGDFTQPHFRAHYLDDKMPGDGSWVFVSSMGDLFCNEVPEEWIERIFKKIIDTEDNIFLLQTKNTQNLFESLFFYERLDELSGKIAVGTTLETNRDTPWTLAPSPVDRWYWLMELKTELETKGIKYHTFLSFEPLAEFDLETLTYMATELRPVAVEIGLENYTSHLPKPTDDAVLMLLEELRQNGVPYILKKNLRYLEETVNE